MGSVLVIGGGPAGASFATRMAQLGAAVTLVERLAFPRPRLGESLTPGVKPLLASTGAWPSIAREAFPAARDVRVLWESAEVLRFKDGSEGLVVDRGRFDQLLLDHAARAGVRVLQPAELVAVTPAGAGWSAEVRHDGALERLQADVLADARGRSTAAGAQRRATGPRTVAVYACWCGEDLPRQAMVAAGAQGWYWAVPLPDGRVNAQAFLDPRRLRQTKQSLAVRYRALIAQSPLAEHLAGARIEGRVSAIDATPGHATEPATANLIRLGDAALSLDPISSSGVQKALQTALSGAIVANTLLRRPGLAPHAIAFYRRSIAAAAARHAAWAGAHHATAARTRPDAFWTNRAGPAAPTDATFPIDFHETVTLAPQARVIDVPCLGDEFVDLQPALDHPGLDEPVAYLARQPLAALLDLPQPASLAALAEAWSARMPPTTAFAIARWLRSRNILVPATGREAAA